MSKLTDKKWWLSILERCLKTFAEAVLGVIGTSYFLAEVNWIAALSAGGLAVIVSFLLNFAFLPSTEKQTETEELSSEERDSLK